MASLHLSILATELNNLTITELQKQFIEDIKNGVLTYENGLEVDLYYSSKHEFEVIVYHKKYERMATLLDDEFDGAVCLNGYTNTHTDFYIVETGGFFWDAYRQAPSDNIRDYELTEHDEIKEFIDDNIECSDFLQSLFEDGIVFEFKN